MKDVWIAFLNNAPGILTGIGAMAMALVNAYILFQNYRARIAHEETAKTINAVAAAVGVAPTPKDN